MKPTATQQLRQDLWKRSIQRRRGVFEDPNTPLPQDPDPEKAYLYQQGAPVQAKVVLPDEEIQSMQGSIDGLTAPYSQQLVQGQQIGQNALKAAVARRAFAEEDRRRKEAADRQYQEKVSQLNSQALANSYVTTKPYEFNPNDPWQMPLQDYTITARYGQKGKMWQTSHGGIDLAAPTGTAVRPVKPGTITKIENHPAFGNVVWVDNGNGITTRYGHLSKFGQYKMGQNVNMSDVIGYVGTTGHSTGPHLHLGFYNNQGQTMDPENYIGHLLNG